MKEAFIIYKSFWKPISKLSNDQLGRLLRAIFSYQNDEAYTVDDDIVMAFEFFANQFRIDDAKYEEKCARLKKNIDKRWHNSKEYNCIQKNTNDSNQYLNDNNKVKEKDNVKGNVKEKKKVNLNGKSEEFIHVWESLCSQPKWKGKSANALSMSLSKLSIYPDDFAIELMERTIANGWQGVVFPDTGQHYEQWKKDKETVSEIGTDDLEPFEI